MSHLHRVTYHVNPLLKNVKLLSTVSGGTITGIVYTLQNSYKQKNLINAFAELYDEHFTGGTTCAELDEMRCHLEARN